MEYLCLRENLMSKLGKFLLGVLLVIVIMIGFSFYVSQGITHLIEQQLTAVKNNNIEEAYSYMSTDYKQTHTADAFRTFVTNHPAMKNNASLSFKADNLDEDYRMNL